MIESACIPLPIQVVIDDVGWWCGEDGHLRQEPYRTGMARNHIPEDYEAIAALGQTLDMRPQAAMILCEWDKDNVLRGLPSATWMGVKWDNRRWAGPWLEQAAEILRRNADHIEIALHGIGHEYWVDGHMERAEWHDTKGRMRPRNDVLRHIEFYHRLLEQHGLGPVPESFVPAAFLHRFGEDENGLAAILRAAGVKSMSTPFKTMYGPVPSGHFGMDAGIMTVDRGADLCRWLDVAPFPQAPLAGPICGMHWPNLLHADPARNHEVVDRWVRFLRPYDSRLDTMLARNTRAFCSQLFYHACARVEIVGEEIQIHFSDAGQMGERPFDNILVLKAASSMPLRFEARALTILSHEIQPRAHGAVNVLMMMRPEGVLEDRIIGRATG